MQSIETLLVLSERHSLPVAFLLTFTGTRAICINSLKEPVSVSLTDVLDSDGHSSAVKSVFAKKGYTLQLSDHDLWEKQACKGNCQERYAPRFRQQHGEEPQRLPSI